MCSASPLAAKVVGPAATHRRPSHSHPGTPHPGISGCMLRETCPRRQLLCCLPPTHRTSGGIHPALSRPQCPRPHCSPPPPPPTLPVRGSSAAVVINCHQPGMQPARCRCLGVRLEIRPLRPSWCLVPWRSTARRWRRKGLLGGGGAEQLPAPGLLRPLRVLHGNCQSSWRRHQGHAVLWLMCATCPCS